MIAQRHRYGSRLIIQLQFCTPQLYYCIRNTRTPMLYTKLLPESDSRCAYFLHLHTCSGRLACKGVRQQSMHFDYAFELAGAHIPARLFHARHLCPRLQGVFLRRVPGNYHNKSVLLPWSLIGAGFIHDVCSDHHSSLVQPRLYHLIYLSFKRHDNCH